MRKFYSAHNQYATQTSVGFANTWYVLVFDSKKSRDEYLEGKTDLASRAITKREIPEYCEAPRKFSSEARRIGPFLYDYEGHEGLVGQVMVSDDRSMERL